MSKTEEKIEEKVETTETPEEPKQAPMPIADNRIDWTAKTQLGKDVQNGKIPSIDVIFSKGLVIQEPEIVDYLLPNLENDIILIGGTPGKGGGIRRTPGRRTARMHKSGRRYKTSCLAICGNRDGYIGIGIGKAIEFRAAAEKALQQAKLNIMPIHRGCGSWECVCGIPHSIPAQSKGKEGSVSVVLKPAPKGIGLAVSNELKKVLELAGIKDLWMKSYGSTSTRINHVKALIDGLRNLNTMRIPEEFKKKAGVLIG